MTWYFLSFKEANGGEDIFLYNRYMHDHALFSKSSSPLGIFCRRIWDYGCPFCINPNGLVEFVETIFPDDLMRHGFIPNDSLGRNIAANKGYFVRHTLAQNGKKAVIAADFQSMCEPITPDQFQHNMGFLLEAYPTLVACAANAKTQVDGLPKLMRIPDETGNLRWQLIIEFKIPDDLKGYGKKHQWTQSKSQVAALMNHPVADEMLCRLDRAAWAMIIDGMKNSGFFQRNIIAWKVGIKQDWERLKGDPVQLTRLLLMPVISILGLASDYLVDHSPADLITSSDSLYRNATVMGDDFAHDTGLHFGISMDGGIDPKTGHHLTWRTSDLAGGLRYDDVTGQCVGR